MAGRRHILVVEDDSLVADVILEALDEVYATSHVGGVEGALERLRGGGIDLILLDCSLPGEPAQMLIEAEREGIPIILMSGDPEMAERLGGGRRFVPKPFTLSVLRGTIAEVVPPG